jgi:hypothetical protein
MMIVGFKTCRVKLVNMITNDVFGNFHDCRYENLLTCVCR